MSGYPIADQATIAFTMPISLKNQVGKEALLHFSARNVLVPQIAILLHQHDEASLFHQLQEGTLQSLPTQLQLVLQLLLFGPVLV